MILRVKITDTNTHNFRTTLKLIAHVGLSENIKENDLFKKQADCHCSNESHWLVPFSPKPIILNDTTYPNKSYIVGKKINRRMGFILNIRKKFDLVILWVILGQI